MTADQVRASLAEQALRYGSQRELAHAIGISPQFFSDIIQGKREPSGSALAFLGLVREVRYVKAKP